MLHPGAIALVTGASSGLGLDLAKALLARGLKVICCARRREPLEAAFADQPNALIHPLDVTDGPAVAGLIAGLPEAWREVDILVANAGSDLGGRQRFDQGSIEDWAGTIETNVVGVQRICHAVIPGMLARGAGHVIILGSIAGLKIATDNSAYTTSKHAIHAFADLLRADYKHEALRVTEILPGVVRTGFATARRRGDQAAGSAFYDSKPDVLVPADITRATLFALEQPPGVNIAQIVVTPTLDK